MPIKPENVWRYPKSWKAISFYVRFQRAGGRCECEGECEADPPHIGRCRAKHGEPHPITLSNVVLTTAHLDHTPETDDPDKLRAMCQRCHLNYDREHHARSRRASAMDANQLSLEDE